MHSPSYEPWHANSAKIPKEFIEPTSDIVIRDGSGRTAWSLTGEWIRGDNGSIIEVICRNDPMFQTRKHIYILKYISFAQRERRHIEREIKLQNVASSLGVTIPIIDSWFTKSGGVMVMDKLADDVGTLLRSFKSLGVQHLIMSKVIGLIFKLKANGIYHGDIYFSNMMWRRTGNPASFLSPDYQRGPPDVQDSDPEISEFLQAGYEIYLIDFGEAGYFLENKQQPYRDLQRLEQAMEDLLADFPYSGLKNVYDSLRVLSGTLL